MGEPVRVELLPVVGRVSAPFLHSGPVLDDPFESGDEEPLVVEPSAADLPWATLRRPPIKLASATVALFVGSAIALATGDPGLGAGYGLVVWLFGSLGSISRRVSFSFGEGFVGYRPDPVWPQGVQEDDDVRWDWRIPREPSEDQSGSQDIR